MTLQQALTMVPILIAGWIATLLAITYLSDEAPAVLVLFPSVAFIQNMPGDIFVTGSSAYSLTLASDHPQLAARLYESGAWIVLPSGLTGCALLSK